MMRSLWSAASGMIAQQTNLDSISNNIANVNTTGYKSEKAEFKSLLYQTLQTRSTSANGDEKPISAQVGLGTRTASITTQFRQGALEATESNTNFAIAGNGFFQVTDGLGNTYYTRDGNFNLVANADGGLDLVTADGYYVQDYNGNRVSFPAGISSSQVYISDGGQLGYYNDDGTLTELGSQMALYQFPNASGLEKVGDNLYQPTAASGGAMSEATTQGLVLSSIKQGYIEMSSVSVADEMVDMIVAQRAYEMNSKAIITSDSMLETANNLKR